MELKVDVPIPTVLVDGALVERAVANLVSNALDHTARGGLVTVTVRRSTSSVALDVRDSGDGIEARDLPHVWDRFFRGERSRRRSTNGSDGVGLGLAIVRGIVEAHAGKVSVRSTPAQGSTFTVEFPLDERASV